MDKSKNVDPTSLMKGYVSLNPSQFAILENADWILDEARLPDNNGYFDVSIPLWMLLGFSEDSRKIVVNAEHELILTRAKTYNNAIVQSGASGDFKIVINIVEWLIPYVTVSNQERIILFRFLGKDSIISMSIICFLKHLEE